MNRIIHSRCAEERIYNRVGHKGCPRRLRVLSRNVNDGPENWKRLISRTVDDMCEDEIRKTCEGQIVKVRIHIHEGNRQ